MGVGRTWVRDSVTVNGDTELIKADPARGGLVVFPHATVDVYLSLSGEAATGSVAAGEYLLKAVSSGNNDPARFLGEDCPTNAVKAYTGSSVTVVRETRKGGRG